jgi:uncharacterized protein
VVPFKPSAINVVITTAFSWQRPALMLFYASTIVVLACSPRWGRYLAPLAPAGRMPLTNYLMQSLICTTLSYGYGFGLFDSVGPAAGLALAFVIYPIQVVASNYWFKAFQYGPMEYLWRVLTYGRTRVASSAEPQTEAAGA